MNRGREQRVARANCIGSRPVGESAGKWKAHRCRTSTQQTTQVPFLFFAAVLGAGNTDLSRRQ